MKFHVLYYDRGTEEDRVGLKYLKSLLGTSEAEVSLVYVTQDFSKMPDERRRDLAREQRSQKQEFQSNEALMEAQEILQGDNLTLTTSAVEGDPVAEVEKLLKEHSFDLLGISAFGRGGFSKNILGAHASKLIKETQLPVLIHKGQLDGCERVLIHVPAKEERCVRFIRYISNLLQGSSPAVTLLSVVEEEHSRFDGYTSGDMGLTDSIENYEQRKHAELKPLKTAKEILQQRGIEANLRYRTGDLSDELLQEAKEGRYDLMTFAPEQPGLLASVWEGSKSFEVMRDVEISVLKYFHK